MWRGVWWPSAVTSRLSPKHGWRDLPTGRLAGDQSGLGGPELPNQDGLVVLAPDIVGWARAGLWSLGRVPRTGDDGQVAAGSQLRGARVALGVAMANAILLVYGLFRPESVEFSLAFLVAPGLAFLWTVTSNQAQSERRLALWVTWGSMAGAVAVVSINWLRQ